ncbi:response regulator [candidate division KSB1 bacterium]|nr:response regulator [candidate division KSB1 bacterium]
MTQTRVLVVDDEEMIRKGCKKILSDMGMEVDMAENGKAGVELLQKNVYDMALVDLMMPGMDGIEFLQHVQQIDEKIVAIVITGYATIESAIKAVKSGAYDYLSKPFTPDELRTIITKGLQRRRLLIEADLLRKERDRNLLEIASERSRTASIINCMGEGLIATNRMGLLVLINPVARKMLRLKNEAIIEKPIKNNLKNEELENLILSTLNNGLTEETIITKEIEFDKILEQVYSITLAPIQEENGEILGLVAVLRDISEVKKIERMKSEFVRLVSHELKAPIGAIEGYLNLIVDGLVHEQDKERFYAIIRKSRDKAVALQKLIRDLLDLSSIDAGQVARHLEPLNLKKLLVEVTDFMQNEAAQKAINIQLIAPDNLPLTRGDKDDLFRLFLNLISNAIKYNRQNGHVSIGIEVEGSFLMTLVQDTGIGMKKEDLHNIFKDFFRANNEFTRKVSGTGLGLPIAKKIVESHHGYIEVESEYGRGSTFRVYLPILSSRMDRSMKTVQEESVPGEA